MLAVILIYVIVTEKFDWVIHSEGHNELKPDCEILEHKHEEAANR